jgi:hypothetical protein
VISVGILEGKIDIRYYLTTVPTNHKDNALIPSPHYTQHG